MSSKYPHVWMDFGVVVLPQGSIGKAFGEFRFCDRTASYLAGPLQILAFEIIESGFSEVLAYAKGFIPKWVHYSSSDNA